MKRIVTRSLWLVLAVSVAAVLYHVYDNRRAAASNAKAAMLAGLEHKDAPSVPAPLPEEASAPADTGPAEALADIDLAALQAVNGDVIGWLEIPDTQVSYPLVQGQDNQFYLSHSWEKKPSGAGAVFLEETNSRDLTGFHLIVYAHRMNKDLMFHSLKYYSDPAYFQAHPSIYLADGTAVRRYDIFAAHEAGVTSLVYRLDLEEHRQELIDFCLDNSVLDTGVVPKPEEQLLTLSTCTGFGHAARWVVQGVLRERYEIPSGTDQEERRIP